MKKILFLVLLCSCSFALFAQDNSDSAMNRKGKMKIKSRPVKDNTLDNGSGDDPTQRRTKTKIKGNIGGMNNGMSNSTMNSSSSTTIVTMSGWTTNPPSLPVVGTDVSSAAVANLKNKYGSTLYDIKKIKSSSGQDIYAVRIMYSGQLKMEFVDESGSTVSQ